MWRVGGGEIVLVDQHCDNGMERLVVGRAVQHVLHAHDGKRHLEAVAYILVGIETRFREQPLTELLLSRVALAGCVAQLSAQYAWREAYGKAIEPSLSQIATQWAQRAVDVSPSLAAQG